MWTIRNQQAMRWADLVQDLHNRTDNITKTKMQTLDLVLLSWYSYCNVLGELLCISWTIIHQQVPSCLRLVQARVLAIAFAFAFVGLVFLLYIN